MHSLSNYNFILSCIQLILVSYSKTQRSRSIQAFLLKSETELIQEGTLRLRCAFWEKLMRVHFQNSFCYISTFLADLWESMKELSRVTGGSSYLSRQMITEFQSRSRLIRIFGKESSRFISYPCRTKKLHGPRRPSIT